MGKVFISYSHKNTAWMERLTVQLKVLQMEGYCSIWNDEEIKSGDDWRPKIETALNEAQVIILMISADFLTSEFIRGQEVPTALQRRQNEGVRVIPVLVKPCPWKTVKWLKEIQMTPRDGQALSEKKDHEIDKALSLIAEDIAESFKATEPPYQSLVGQKISTSKLPNTGKYFFGREKQLKILDDAWNDEHQRIVTLIAFGGVGKSALVNKWLMTMEKENFHGAQKVYGWSFYSQGAEEGKQASADLFIQETLQWFGDPNPTHGDTMSKTHRLIALIKKQKTLLILDGVEPLQYPPDTVKGFDGKLKDPALRTLLRELSMSMNGLCLITSRVTLTDLDDRTGHTVREIPLEHLSENTGVQLLQEMGLKGLKTHFRAAVKEYDGHALALSLLGQYVKSAYNGDIRKRDKIPALTVEPKQGDHARRVMAAYETWLGDSVERNILYLLGLFDRPAQAGAMDALKAGDPIPGVTDRLTGISEEQWNIAVANLRNMGLIVGADNPDPVATLDCHPLVREHFGELLQKQHADAWTESNRRLYKYYKNLPKKEQPDTLEEMEPLFAAVAHGCRAGLYYDAFANTFYERILRGGSEYYLWRKLGAFGAYLSVLSHFFDHPWGVPAAGLTEGAQALVLSQAAFGLRALGRLTEAKQAMWATLERYKQINDSKEIAVAANNLSELLLTLGETAEAVRFGKESVTHADRSGDDFMKEAVRTGLADALHQAGETDDAENLFREAEGIQQERQPEFKYLYTLKGYRFCDLLLDRGRTAEVMERAETALEIATEKGWLLHIALDNLTLGRARMMQAEADGDADFSPALADLDRAVQGLRKSGDQDYLALSLISRAACRRLMQDYEKARADLAEAEDIARLGNMKLYLVDYHLERARLALAENKEDEARRHKDTAEKLIEETGYKRRKAGVRE